MDQHANKLLSYRPDIDGLRSFAIIPVVLFHANVALLSGGFVGVDVFFVISGFLIGSLVYRETTESRFSLKRFYARRAKRILPALFALLAFCFVPACVLLSGAELKGFSNEVLTTLASTSNIYFGLNSDYFASVAELHPLLMTWSLGVEEQFYIFFPLIMFLLVRYARRHILGVLGVLSLLSLLLAVVALPRFPTPTFYMLPSRAWELGIGTMLGIYEILRRERTGTDRRGWVLELESTVGMTLLLLGILLFTRDTPFPGLLALVPTVAAALLIRARGSWINRKILASKPLVAIGLVSYSWYLWHWPLMSFARISMAGELPLGIGLTTVVLSLGLAVLSYFFVEQPFRKPAPPSHGILWRYGLGSGLFAVVSCLLLATHGWASRYPAAAQVDEANLRSGPDPCLVRYRKTQFLDTAECVNHDGTTPTLVILGDSHAAALAPALRGLAAAAGWRVDDLTKASCPPLGVVSRYMPMRLHHDTECEAFNQNALQLVMNAPNVKTVLLAGYWTAPFPSHDNGERFVRTDEPAGKTSVEQSWMNLQSGLLETVQLLQSHGKRVLVGTDVPRLPLDPILAARTRAIPTRLWLNDALHGPDVTGNTRPLSSLLEPVDARANAILATVAQRTGTQVIDLSAGLCPGGVCASEQGLIPLYVDDQHLGLEGALVALEQIRLFE